MLLLLLLATAISRRLLFCDTSEWIFTIVYRPAVEHLFGYRAARWFDCQWLWLVVVWYTSVCCNLSIVYIKYACLVLPCCCAFCRRWIWITVVLKNTRLVADSEQEKTALDLRRTNCISLTQHLDPWPWPLSPVSYGQLVITYSLQRLRSIGAKDRVETNRWTDERRRLHYVRS